MPKSRIAGLKLIPLVIVAAILGIFIGSSLPMVALSTRYAVSSTPLPRPRFEVIYTQHMENNELTYNADLAVIHDKESGQEVVCATNTGTVSRTCWTTGRSWK